MQLIERLSPTAVDYLISFNAHAVAISPTGYVYTTANPGGASRAWWCRRDDAVRVAKAAFASGDVEAIAKRLRINLTEHATVVERVRARTQQLDEALQRAQDEGLLKTFNISYRKRRLAARVTGQRFMTYGKARQRLHKAITDAIANGGVITKSLVNQALEI